MTVVRKTRIENYIKRIKNEPLKNILRNNTFVLMTIVGLNFPLPPKIINFNVRKKGKFAFFLLIVDFILSIALTFRLLLSAMLF